MTIRLVPAIACALLFCASRAQADFPSANAETKFAHSAIQLSQDGDEWSPEARQAELDEDFTSEDGHINVQYSRENIEREKAEWRKKHLASGDAATCHAGSVALLGKVGYARCKTRDGKHRFNVTLGSAGLSFGIKYMNFGLFCWEEASRQVLAPHPWSGNYLAVSLTIDVLAGFNQIVLKSDSRKCLISGYSGGLSLDSASVGRLRIGKY